MDDSINNFMVDNRIRFLENRDNNSRWCDPDNGSNLECPDLDFVYSDTDTHPNEIAELYSYTEQSEFHLNIRAFEEQMAYYRLVPSWQKLTVNQRKDVILKLLDQLDLSRKNLRMQAARTILYLAQGCFCEVQSDHEQLEWTRENVKLLYNMGVFAVFVELLNYEIENSSATNIAMRKVAVSLADSVDLRIILSVLYIMTEVIRNEKVAGSNDFKDIAETFTNELNAPIGDELLAVKLLNMITRFCGGTAPHFPMKKVLLLLWKISLVSLGGMDTLRRLKDEYRKQNNLSPVKEDTLEVARNMRPSSPPATVADMLDNQNAKRNRPFRRQSLIKQSSLDEQEQMTLEQQENDEEINDDYRPTTNGTDTTTPPENPNPENEDTVSSNGTTALTMAPSTTAPPNWNQIIKLPWAPKVRQKDIDQFLYDSRNKFIGYSFTGDHESLAGLPHPIHEGYNILKKHMYTSLSDIHIKREEEIARNPLVNVENDIPMTPAEILYQAILPNLPQCMIALLKILLAASPTSKAKTESINIMADVLPEEMPVTVTQSTKLGIDVNRHKEIIIKAVSAILLLYLKHFKINHVYQFEVMSQHLVFANCIPLVLKFFNQNLLGYVGSKNVIPILDFPACIIGDSPPELTSDSLVIGDTAPYSWRNIFSCINLLRILNKLTKWKHSRVMMLVVFKAAPILKRTLKVRHALMQLYVLKLLKMQTKYLGRQWRKTNMKIISAIYEKVRHRLNDDWAFGNDLDARPWDFQMEECTLRSCVDRFNNRRYLSAQAYMNAKNAHVMPHLLPNANNANIQVSATSSSMSNQIGFAAGGVGTIGNSNAVNSNGIANSCGISQIGNSNGQPQSNEFNEPYDNNSLIDIAVGSHFLNGGQERSSYTSGYGAWDMENVDLSEDFKKHYEVWLQKEVFSIKIDWDSLRTVYDIEMDDNKVNGKTLNDATAKIDSKVVIQ
ncbi:striatin-interacting protein 1 homolog isoform X2 [Sitodiplosis mosellana]|uniref:striatin-interacting protein 1 homolog isoform X2 n=1 Tax=Sitodiplosis mosellana TaxID=263140 RepID=UPI0024447B10|nr:striatin-interacting protein 1 homolog isoform X2 [Sitodiplosis mosellana]XP_055313184.1 striatin-interacting protein 1 homolog isoform X2 [Sitodiplosis mosellana]XP_055313185.1 striatin-interacting protein 1 homolog isoform X2 [Sitodiplosis mosellana]